MDVHDLAGDPHWRGIQRHAVPAVDAGERVGDGVGNKSLKIVVGRRPSVVGKTRRIRHGGSETTSLMAPNFKPLPDQALEICKSVHAPPRLVAHLTLVHDVACTLIGEFESRFPEVNVRAGDVLFGAATHDIGKAVCPEELVGAGESHTKKGFDVLKNFGIPEQRARFSVTHGNWREQSDVTIEDLLVALADKCWKGKRVPDLETKVVDEIVRQTGKNRWEVFLSVDDIIERLAVDADERLAWQAQFPV